MAAEAESTNVIPYDFAKTFFPQEVNGKLNTIEFLEASKGIVQLVEKMGKVFLPLSGDISGNIEKIKKCYDKNPAKYAYIEDLILSEKSETEDASVDALLWLRRALHFILIFFQNIVNDNKKSESLQDHMSSAYSQTLEPYHNWITKNLFKVFKNLAPKRSQLLTTILGDKSDSENADENLIKFLQVYFKSLADNVQHIISFYKEHNLDSNARV